MRLSKKSIAITSIIICLTFITKQLTTKTYWIEKNYTTNIYPKLSEFFRLLLGWIPFSAGDTIALFLIAYVIYIGFKLIKKRISIASFLTQIISLLAILYCCFYFFWGFNYFRAPLAEKLNIQQAKYTTDELVNTTTKIITKLNEQHCLLTQNDTLVVQPLSISEIFEKAPEGYDSIEKKHPDLAYKHASIKKSLVSYMHMYTGTSGYFNPITGEAQVNDLIPKTGMPATTCHEMAHQIGWSAENDANFISFLTCKANSNPHFKYSGYRMAFIYLIREVRKRDKIKEGELWLSLNKGIIKDLKNTRKYWQQFKNPIEPLIDKGYNSYLKANNQTSGIQSYSYVVDLLIAYDKQQSL